MNSRKRQRIAFGVTILSLAGIVAFSYFRTRASESVQLDLIVAEVRSGATTRPFDGRLILNRVERNLTEDGIAYLTGPEPTHILFPRWRGPGTKLAGYLWSRDALDVGSEVMLLVPRSQRPADGEVITTIAPTTMRAVRVTSLRRPGWYDVERSVE